MMKRGMKDKMGRAMAMRGDMADKMGRAMAKPMGMKKGGKVKKMQMGGPTARPLPSERYDAQRAARGGQGMKQGPRFAKGGSIGSASKRADGVAHKGKTKGKMVKMAYGGKC